MRAKARKPDLCPGSSGGASPALLRQPHTTGRTALSVTPPRPLLPSHTLHPHPLTPFCHPPPSFSSAPILSISKYFAESPFPPEDGHELGLFGLGIVGVNCGSIEEKWVHFVAIQGLPGPDLCVSRSFGLSWTGSWVCHIGFSLASCSRTVAWQSWST